MKFESWISRRERKIQRMPEACAHDQPKHCILMTAEVPVSREDAKNGMYKTSIGRAENTEKLRNPLYFARDSKMSKIAKDKTGLEIILHTKILRVLSKATHTLLKPLVWHQSAAWCVWC